MNRTTRLLVRVLWVVTVALGCLGLAAEPADLAAARALYEADRLAQARRALETLAMGDPVTPEVHFLLGEIALRQNDPERAVGCFENAVAVAPSFSLYHHRLGDAYGRAAQRASIFSAFGFARKCLRAYQRAVELAPDNVDARFSLFMFYRGAPAIIGGGAGKAAAEAAEIEKRDPARGRIAFAALRVAQKQFREARAAIAEIQPLDLSAAMGDRVFLSDVHWTSAEVGWGEPVRNHLWLDERSSHDVVLIVHGRLYGKGLFAPAPSRHLYALDRKWKTLSTTIGLRDGAPGPASAVFIVRGDGRELFRSATLRVDMSQRVKVDVSHVRELELVTQPGDQDQPSAWAVWAEPLLRR